MAKRRWPTADGGNSDLTMFQVKFKSGQGQQVPAPSAEHVRAEMVRVYGEDYAIESIEEVKKAE